MTYLSEIDRTVVEQHESDNQVRHYVTAKDGHRPVFEPFIPDTSYADLLSGAVIKCVDVLLIDTSTGEVLIANRKQEPMSGKWVFGGRKRAGETNTDTVVNNMAREFNMKVDPQSLINTGHEYDEIWDSRSDAHSNTVTRGGDLVTGCHTTSSAYVLPVDKSQIDLASHNEEFNATEWTSIDLILSSEPGTYHPALLDMVTDGLDALTQPDDASTIDESIFRATTTLNHLHLQKSQQKRLLADVVVALTSRVK